MSRRLLDHGAVDPGEALGGNLRAKLLAQFEVALRPQLQGRPLLRAQAHAIGDVVLGDDQVFAEIVLAPDDDVAVRMAGVVVVHRHPIELGPEVGLHLAHHVAGEAAQVREAVAVLGRDDEAEGMPVAFASLDEGLAILLVALGSVELTALAVAGRAVPLDVAQMRARRTAAGAVTDDPRLHHHPPLALAGGTLRRLPLQRIRHGLAPADPRAPSLPGRTPAPLPAAQLGLGQRTAIGLGRRLHHLGDERLRPTTAGAAPIADAARAGAEVGSVVCGSWAIGGRPPLRDKPKPADLVQTGAKTSA